MAECPPTAGLINSLDPASPTDPDRVFCADDWFRFIQQVIKTNQFPKSEDDSNNGWDIALTVKASEVNSLQGIGSAQTVEQRLTALEAGNAKFPGGNTVFLLFHNQVSAIPGWTQTTTDLADNRMLRVVNTAGVSSGGSNNPINMAASDVPAHTHSGSVTGGGAHDHRIWQPFQGGAADGILLQSQAGMVTPQIVGTNGLKLIVNGEGTHSHGLTINNSSGPASWQPRYVDTILASKD